MFIDYLTLMLLNMVAGLVLAAGFVTCGLRRENRNLKAWAAPFFMVAAVALTTGFAMVFTWPIPAKFGSAYNAIFGEMTVILGIVFLGASISLMREISLTGVAIYAAIGGAAAVLLGIRILNLYANGIHVTASPPMSATGFILTGLGGLLLPLSLKGNVAMRAINGIVFLAAAALWAVTAGMAYWMHLSLWLQKPA